MNPHTHLAYERERRADLVREARRNDLAADVGRARGDERRSFLVRMWGRRHSPQPVVRSNAS